MATEKRLICAMQTVTKMSGRITPLIRMGENPVRIYNEALQVIAEAPTVDAVEVVQCKDCKWFADNCGGVWFGCALFNAIRAVPDDAPKDNDYCCWAERKDND